MENQMAQIGSVKIRPYGKRLLVKPIAVEARVGVIVIPEKAAAPFGKSRTGMPLKYGEVLEKGKDAPESILVGERVVVDPMNANPVTVDGQEVWLVDADSILVVESK
jgi:co-chaperonin GroES (HSP10)